MTCPRCRGRMFRNRADLKEWECFACGRTVRIGDAITILTERIRGPNRRSFVSFDRPCACGAPLGINNKTGLCTACRYDSRVR